MDLNERDEVKKAESPGRQGHLREFGGKGFMKLRNNGQKGRREMKRQWR